MLTVGTLFGALTLAVQARSPYFKIQVVDADTKRGVPLVELATVNKIRLYTDSNGLIAFNEPGLMERRVFFTVRSHGYEYPSDSFGYRGILLLTHAGGAETIKLKRLNIAERICRLTGEGIYGDSALLNVPAPISEPVLNGGVLGQDTAQAELYKGRMIWFWGDTDRAEYPLGNFHTSGADASFPAGMQDASSGIEYHYLTGRDGFVRPMVPSTVSKPIWISGLTILGGGAHQEMFAFYAQMKSLGNIQESGYLKWDDRTREFSIVQRFASTNDWRHLDGHTAQIIDQGQTYAVGNFPLNVRVPATTENFLRPSAYQAFTCLNADGSILRDSSGKPEYRWQSDLPPVTPEIERKLVDQGLLKQQEAHFLPVDEHGNNIFPHGGSIHWNEYRSKWIAIFTRLGGKDSFLGEIYYSESDDPTGPFRRATKILTHDKYTFYNPVHHPFLDTHDGRVIYLEGTYTAEFSGNPDPTPKYNYNQILYRLDLADPRLAFAEKP